MGLQVSFFVEFPATTLVGTLEVRLSFVFLDVRCHVTYLIIGLVAAFHGALDLRFVGLQVRLEPCLVWEPLVAVWLGATETPELLNVILGVLEQCFGRVESLSAFRVVAPI